MSTLSVFTVNEIPQMWPVKIHKETTPFWTQPRSFSSKSQNQTTVSSRQVGVVTVVVVGNSSKRLLLLRCWSGLPKSLVSQWGIYGFWHPACTGISICRGNWDELDKIFGELRKEIHEHSKENYKFLTADARRKRHFHTWQPKHIPRVVEMPLKKCYAGAGDCRHIHITNANSCVIIPEYLLELIRQFQENSAAQKFRTNKPKN